MSLPPPTPDKIKEVNSQLSTIMSDRSLVGTPAKAHIDKELMPVVEKLVSCGAYYRNQHPEITDLFNWFMQPQRTVEEFHYVLGPLASHCLNRLIFDGYTVFVGSAALEVLAIKCPVLEGPWENVMWLIMRLIYSSAPKAFIASERLSAWIICMVGDADICPNAYLRIELIFLLKMVKLDVVSKSQLLEAMMKACSNLNSDYLWRNDHNKNYNKCSALRFKSIVNRLKRIEYCLPDGLSEFGKKLAKKLNDVNASRLSSIVYDVNNIHGLNPSNYNEPWELQTLIALLNTTAGYAHGEYDKFYDEFSQDCTMYMSKLLVHKFKPCYQMPQLIYPMSSFIINVMEYAIIGTLGQPTYDYEWQMPIEIDKSNVIIMDQLLEEIFTDNGSFAFGKSAIWQELIFRYGKRLKSLKDRFGNLDDYPTIFIMMEHI